jgi:O-acetyl-ADP-ribose deacetylase (regulator of RNase III)
LKPRLILSDQDPEVLAAWRTQFAKWPEVDIVERDLLEVPADAFLVPGNSFGFLDGGLELRVQETFGWSIQDELRKIIRTDLAGELLVGQAVVLRLPALPRPMIYAPVWRTPGDLSGTVNVFLALRGAFLAMEADAGSPSIGSLAAPGVAVGGPSGLHPATSARQMRYAYEIAAGLRGLGDKNLSQLTRRQRKLASVPQTAVESDLDS